MDVLNRWWESFHSVYTYIKSSWGTFQIASNFVCQSCLNKPAYRSSSMNTIRRTHTQDTVRYDDTWNSGGNTVKRIFPIHLFLYSKDLLRKTIYQPFRIYFLKRFWTISWTWKKHIVLTYIPHQEKIYSYIQSHLLSIFCVLCDRDTKWPWQRQLWFRGVSPRIAASTEIFENTKESTNVAWHWWFTYKNKSPLKNWKKGVPGTWNCKCKDMEMRGNMEYSEKRKKLNMA